MDQINGLRLAEYMIENRPPRLPVPGRDHASARTPDDRERRAQARRAAEALFTPKPPTLEPIAVPPAAPREAISAPTHLEPPPAKVLPAAHLRRIRTWVGYGMTIPQVAEIYGVEVDAIVRILRRA